MKNILLTGGTGFIGSHIAVELIEKNYNVFIIDNLVNSKIEVVDKIKEITGVKPNFDIVDITDYNKLFGYFDDNKIDAVIHLAGLKAVGESVREPLKYYENNVSGTINLLKCMIAHNVNNLVFSSSACVYGDCKIVPIKEDAPNQVINPYGRTKLMIENIIEDVHKSNPKFNATILRYFNPIGAHKSGLIGEDPNNIPNNLMPYILKVATGEFDHLSIYGNDYKTKDGTGVRDYIHVVDLAKGHLCALNRLFENGGLNIYNLGTGRGTSVLELVNIFNKVNNTNIKYEVVARREGDSEAIFTDPNKAEKELGWKSELTIEDMCKDAYNFIFKNLGENNEK